jgi:lipopolysaccharide transport system ATP-binding protein
VISEYGKKSTTSFPIWTKQSKSAKQRKLIQPIKQMQPIKPKQPIISVKNIGKKYKLGATLGGRNYKTLRDVLTQAAFSPFRKLSAAFRKEPTTGVSHSSPNNPITKSPNNPITKSPNNSNEFWALKDISFDVQQGEVVGIIGANGAGKSTLLKILSEITEPTEGEICIRGRVASLLEVGTGFHPELSGRENVYMNGAILGMSKAEIRSKFDEIVSFAGVEDFVDTPVKRYSSGMRVRLAFAVAAHLEEEILLVDEVLAVGDVAFQKKSLGKMEKITHAGRTILFVSHNMGAIRQLVSRCLLLQDGRIVFDGDSSECISRYLAEETHEMTGHRAFSNRKPTIRKPIVIKTISLRNRKKSDCIGVFELGSSWYLEIGLEAEKENIRFCSSLRIYDDRGVSVYHFVSFDTYPTDFVSKYKTIITVYLPKLKLYPGKYFVDVFIGHSNKGGDEIDKIESAICFEVNQARGLEVSRPLVNSKGIVYEYAQWDIY